MACWTRKQGNTKIPELCSGIFVLGGFFGFAHALGLLLAAAGFGDLSICFPKRSGAFARNVVSCWHNRR